MKNKNNRQGYIDYVSLFEAVKFFLPNLTPLRGINNLKKDDKQKQLFLLLAILELASLVKRDSLSYSVYKEAVSNLNKSIGISMDYEEFSDLLKKSINYIVLYNFAIKSDVKLKFSL